MNYPILERMLTKRAASMDLGEGITYEYNGKDPKAVRDAQILRDLRKPYGAGKALAAGIVPGLLTGLLSGVGTYAVSHKDPDALKHALLWGGAMGTLGTGLGALSMYGKRIPIEDALQDLEALRGIEAKDMPKKVIPRTIKG